MNKKAILLILAVLAGGWIVLFLVSGKPMKPILVKDLEQVTCTEYTADGPVSREITMSTELEYLKSQLQYRDDIEYQDLSEYRSTGKKPAKPAKYLLLKYLFTDKQERALKFFADGEMELY